MTDAGWKQSPSLGFKLLRALEEILLLEPAVGKEVVQVVRAGSQSSSSVGPFFTPNEMQSFGGF